MTLKSCKNKVFIILAFAMISCNEQKESTIPTQYSNASFISTLIDPSNINNPYDSVGIDHNECMAYMGSYQGYDFTDSASAVNSFKNAFISYEASKGRIMTVEEKQNFFQPQLYKTFNEACIANNYSQELKTFVYAIRAQVVREDSTLADILAVIAEIKSVETSILNSTTLSNFEKQTLLCYASICRYSSTNSWQTKNYPNNSTWYNNSSLDMPVMTLTNQETIDQADSDAFWGAASGSSIYFYHVFCNASRKASSAAYYGIADRAGLFSRGVEDDCWHIRNAF
jgi:hypothetical protein